MFMNLAPEFLFFLTFFVLIVFLPSPCLNILPYHNSFCPYFLLTIFFRFSPPFHYSPIPHSSPLCSSFFLQLIFSPTFQCSPFLPLSSLFTFSSFLANMHAPVQPSSSPLIFPSTSQYSPFLPLSSLFTFSSFLANMHLFLLPPHH
jgi:hypothetical protein